MSTPTILLAIPPFTQLNTPYPSIAYLARHLQRHNFSCSLRDLGIELALRIYSKAGLIAIFDQLALLSETEELPEEAWRALILRRHYEKSIDDIVAFLQGKDNTLAPKILAGHLLPIGPRLDNADLSSFGTMGQNDAARYLATLYLEDISDIITEMIDPGFSFTRYQPQLATGPVSFDPIAKRLEETTLIDSWLDELTSTIKADIVGLSLPFPGTLYAGLRIGRALKKRGVTVWMGGGYINTELRDINDQRFWSCVDKLTYDDGEGPILELLHNHLGQPATLHRTRSEHLYYKGPARTADFIAAAHYADLDLSQYMQVLDTLNPAHRLWSDGRWNKITLAHGCYWKKCAFCDVHLDYIERYEPAKISNLVDMIEELIENTGISGFHFVDEAAPPKLLKELALELLRREIQISWWGNIRFERAFTPDLCRLLATAGLIAVTGGLETASDRLLAKMNKGVTIEQAAQTAAAFQQSGVMVHAYLMYGFPTQSKQETIDAMEVVRQFFAEGLLSSAFWHRFTLTKHSEIFQQPEHFKIQFAPIPSDVFASNDIEHLDPFGCDHDIFDVPLVEALNQWMQGNELHTPAHHFFDQKMPKTKIEKKHIAQAISHSVHKNDGRLLWLGQEPLLGQGILILHTLDNNCALSLSSTEEDWVLSTLDEAALHNDDRPLFSTVQNRYPFGTKKFRKLWRKLCIMGMLVL